MATLLTLPRELRDMIYTFILTSSLSPPELSSTSQVSLWCRPWEPKSGLGNNGCAFSSRRAPNTCANFLATCQQVHEEMTWMMTRLRRKGDLGARMDCMSDGVGGHWFTWLSIPIVHTATAPPSSESSSPSSTLRRGFLGKYLPQSRYSEGVKRTMTIEQLTIDVRLFEGGKQEPETARDKTSWAICAALKHVFEHDPEIIPTRDCRNEIYINEVVLDILPNFAPSTDQTPSSAYDLLFADDEVPTSQEEILAKELVNVWNSLWTADSFKARYYRNLLERIGKVRVCVEGKTWRVRELGDELERGKKERKRIEMRGGWWSGGNGVERMV